MEEGTEAPAGYVTKKATGKEFAGMLYRMQVSPLDCTGCGNCVEMCPAKTKALVMQPLDTQRKEEENWEFAMTVPEVADRITNKASVKNSQALKPLFEFSGACAGCGETPYVKLVTQLFGDRMMIANATGCSSIYGGSAPTCPYTVNQEGHGPAWANSLFEDNAEFGFGMNLAVTQRREKLADTVRKLIAVEYCWDEIKKAGQEWLDNMNDAEGSKAAGKKLLAACKEGVVEGCNCEACTLGREVIAGADLLTKKSIWIFGGDGWAYDIGYGGVDHVLAQNRGCQHPGAGYRSVLQHRRTGFQVHAYRLRGEVRRCRQADQEEGPGHDGHELRLCVRGHRGHERQSRSAAQGHDRG